jgi:magnesium-transporting ATPase (P-type)
MMWGGFCKTSRRADLRTLYDLRKSQQSLQFIHVFFFTFLYCLCRRASRCFLSILCTRNFFSVMHMHMFVFYVFTIRFPLLKGEFSRCFHFRKEIHFKTDR